MSARNKSVFVLLMICCLFCGCYSHRWIHESEIRKIPSDKNRILLCWKNNRIPLDNVQIIENHILGNRGKFALHNNLTRVHIDSAFPLYNFFATGVYKIPDNAVERIELQETKFNFTKTFLAISGLTALIFLYFASTALPNSG